MKTILYNPIFINPQAYYVFPRLTRYLQPDNESTAEPANYIGTIEVKVIAYGDTTLKRTYTNTDSIDLSEFKNTWIRISLFTKVGSCVLGEWKIGNMESDLPYIDPEVLASLKAVVIVGNKTNNDSDRAIVKNLVDASNPFVISNASYNLNSGYGKYNITFQHFPYRENIISINDNKVVFDKGGQLLLPYPSMDRDIPSFKVKVSGLSGTYHFRYYYRDSNGAQDSINMAKDGIYELPICYNVQSSSDGTNCGFANNGSDIVTIEQVPEFQGAFVTDGVNDTIISTKTAAEMGITDEVTVVSMIHQITLNTKYNIATTNYIENSDTKEHVRTDAYVAGKTGIYGYTASLINSTRSTIGYILGDIRDYQAVGTTNKQTILDSKFSVEGRVGGFGEVSSVAWYWTVIANKILTADQINQVIAYYDLDRTLSPDIYCDVAKQGITNSNHTDFDDKLIDYSGNGRDIQLNNLAWDGDSGIGKYNYPNWKVNVTQGNKYARIVYYDSINGTYSANFKGITDLYKSYGLSIEIRVNRANTVDFHSIKEDGIYTITPPDDTTSIDIRFGGENVYNASCDITITQIPSHAGALCLDGVNDFGQFVGDLGLKDYTLIMNRAYNNLINNQVPLVSSNIVEDQTPFIVEHWNTGSNAISFSYGASRTTDIPLDINKKIVYQSTYSYMGYVIPKGNAISTGGGITLGKFGNGVQYSAICLWSLMLFPYSMSEFLIERQLKKHKLGTLYPNMMEFRPIIKSNIDTLKINYWDKDWNVVNVGDYVSVGNDIKTNITVPNGYKVSKVTSDAFDNITIEKSSTDFIYDVKFYGIKKSPQKITMTIEQDENYVKFEPVITSNVEYVRLDFYLNNYQKRINIGDYIPKDAYLRANFYLKNNVDELTVFTFNGVNIGYRRSSVDDTAFNINQIYNYDSPQEVNITIDEYIRYEDIVQPYPVLLRFNDENGNEVSWGGKLRVGSTITRIGSAADSNLLPNIYNIFGLLLNDNQVTSSKVIVEKTMVFKAKSAYIFDNNEPKCILSPSRLRIPNSSYKLLGYIPDISGHGNHGKINNSAYAGMSGVNGYPVVFGASKTWANESNGYVTSITSNTIHITNVLNAGLALLYSYVKYNGNLQNIKEIPPFKIEIKGLEGRSKFIYKYLATSDATKETNLYLGNGTHELPKSFLPTEALINNAVVGFSISPIEEGVTNFLSDITIKVLPEYEGAYCLDGVDDFVTIPTTVGGKQMLMKVNWDKTIADAILYDQRGYPNEFAIYNADNDNSGNPVFAYQARNNGQTYIDGILNKNIKASELRAITHNITITNELQAGVNQSYAVIGSNRVNDAYFTKMALYDFMLFDEISTDDKIKELNEYVGIEGNT